MEFRGEKTELHFSLRGRLEDLSRTSLCNVDFLERGLGLGVGKNEYTTHSQYFEYFKYCNHKPVKKDL